VDDAVELTEVDAPPFVAGLELAETLYAQGVAPLVADRLPGLRYGAALVGPGSDVLGYDTPVSTDHDWGPRLQLFLEEHQLERHGTELADILAKTLPAEVGGHPTRFGDPPRQQVEVTTVSRFASALVGFDPLEKVTLRDWLTTPQQRLLELTTGRVFRDELGELERLRATLAFYPEPVWLYLMAAQWRRISQLEPFVGRAGVVGDDVGSRAVATTLVRDLMRLAFLMERRYAPYEKWFGSAFARLACARRLGPVLGRVLAAYDWTQRENHLVEAYRIVATLHNNLGLTPELDPEPAPFHERPYKVIRGDRFAVALHDAIGHEGVKGLPPGLGGIDQVTDNVDVLTSAVRCRALSVLWR